MNFGNMLGNLAVSAGRGVMYATEQKQREANLAQTQTKTALEQMDLLQKQQDVQGRQEVSAELSGANSDFQASGKTQGDIANFSTKGAAAALAHNQFGLAKQYEEFGKLATENLKAQATEKVLETTQKEKTLGTMAIDYQANPTPEGADALVRQAILAGKNPKEIPLKSDPKFDAWAKNQQTAGLDSGKRAEFLQKEADVRQKAEDRKKELSDKAVDRAEARKDRALVQAGLTADRKARQELLSESLALRKSQAGGEGKLTAQERNTIDGVVAASGEALRGLNIIAKMPSDQVAGAFAGLHGAGITDAILRVGGNIVTPESSQLYTVATQGLGMEIGRALTLGGGRGVTQAQIDEYQSMIQARPGDTEAVAMFKYSNAASTLRNRLETLPDSPNPKVHAQQEKYMKDLEKIPDPSEILAATRDPKVLAALKKTQSDMGTALTKLTSGPTTPAATSPAPTETQTIGGVEYHKVNGKWVH